MQELNPGDQTWYLSEDGCTLEQLPFIDPKTGAPSAKEASSPQRAVSPTPAAPAKRGTASAVRWASGAPPAHWAKSSTRCSRWAPAWTRSPTSGSFCTSTSCPSRSWIWTRCRATGWNWKICTPCWPKHRPAPTRWKRSCYAEAKNAEAEARRAYLSAHGAASASGEGRALDALTEELSRRKTALDTAARKAEKAESALARTQSLLAVLRRSGFAAGIKAEELTADTLPQLTAWLSNVAPKKTLREFRLEDVSAMNVGDVLKADVFAEGDKVDVVGVSKGKGYQGVIKRYGQHRLRESHGTGPVARHAGSNGSTSTPARVFPGKRLPGHMGFVRVTVQNLTVVKVDTENNLIAVKGAVPGSKGTIITLANSVKA